MKITANGNRAMNYTLDGPAGAPVVTLSLSLAIRISRCGEPQMKALTGALPRAALTTARPRRTGRAGRRPTRCRSGRRNRPRAAGGARHRPQRTGVGPVDGPA